MDNEYKKELEKYLQDNRDNLNFDKLVEFYGELTDYEEEIKDIFYEESGSDGWIVLVIEEGSHMFYSTNIPYEQETLYAVVFDFDKDIITKVLNLVDENNCCDVITYKIEVKHDLIIFEVSYEGYDVLGFQHNERGIEVFSLGCMDFLKCEKDK